MKRIFISLLTCGICVTAFAQIDTSRKINPGNSDKWEIIKGNAKSSTGKLFVTLPKGTEWDMTIYAAGTTKVLSNTSLKTSITLQPGTYDLLINHIWIKGVPVEKGNNTRLKAGVLHMTTTDSWTLYDEPKKIVLINSLSPQERGLPIGKYKITIMGQDQDVEITDEAPGQEPLPIIETDKWVMTPVSDTSGRLAMEFPLELPDAIFPVLTRLRIYNSNNNDIYWCAGHFCPAKYPLPEGSYTIHFSCYNYNCPGIAIPVPIQQGYETRLKAGYLQCLSMGLYKIFDESKQAEILIYNIQGRGIYPLLVGTYTIELMGIGKFKMQMKDGEISVLNPMDSLPIPGPKWTVTTINKMDMPAGKFGRLNTFFPNADNISLYIRIPNPTNPTNPKGFGYTSVRLDTLRSYDLLPGQYQAYLNKIPIKLPIQSGKETKIRFGYLKLLYSEEKGWKITSASSEDYWAGNGSKILAFPIGYYKILENYHSHLIKIVEGTTVDFPLPNTPSDH